MVSFINDTFSGVENTGNLCRFGWVPECSYCPIHSLFLMFILHKKNIKEKKYLLREVKRKAKALWLCISYYNWNAEGETSTCPLTCTPYKPVLITNLYPLQTNTNH